MTSKESMDFYLQVKNEINPFKEKLREKANFLLKEEKMWLIEAAISWDKDRDMRIAEARRAIIPGVGMSCKVCYYTDCHAATITEIISPRKVRVRDNKTKCLDYYAGEYEILPELDGREYIFTKRSNGKWILEGQKSKDGLSLQLHYQHHFIDPSF